jgi:hypothetical protein
MHLFTASLDVGPNAAASINGRADEAVRPWVFWQKSGLMPWRERLLGCVAVGDQGRGESDMRQVIRTRPGCSRQ